MALDEVEELIEALNDEFLRRGTVRKLAWLGDARAAEPLINAIRKDNDLKLVEPVTEGLKRIGEGALPALMSAIHDSNVTVRELVVEVLGEIGNQEALKPLINVLLNDSSRFVQQSAVEALGKLGNAEAVEPLVSMLGAENQFLRWAVVEALGKIGDVRANEPLKRMLNDVSQEVKTAAYISLNQLGYRSSDFDTSN